MIQRVSSVSSFALANSVNSKKFRDFVIESKADVILVGSWSEKFGIDTLELTKYGVINCHPSLLPLHRGANPYFWQIYSGDKKAGVTFHLMDENFDTGDILLQKTWTGPSPLPSRKQTTWPSIVRIYISG